MFGPCKEPIGEAKNGKPKTVRQCRVEQAADVIVPNIFPPASLVVPSRDAESGSKCDRSVQVKLRRDHSPMVGEFARLRSEAASILAPD